LFVQKAGYVVDLSLRIVALNAPFAMRNLLGFENDACVCHDQADHENVKGRSPSLRESPTRVRLARGTINYLLGTSIGTPYRAQAWSIALPEPKGGTHDEA
jgi:hypothetical protein